MQTYEDDEGDLQRDGVLERRYEPWTNLVVELNGERQTLRRKPTDEEWTQPILSKIKKNSTDHNTVCAADLDTCSSRLM